MARRNFIQIWLNSYWKWTISELPVASNTFHSNLIEFLLKIHDFRTPGGAPGGQAQISLKFDTILIQNWRFPISRWPDPHLKVAVQFVGRPAPGLWGSSPVSVLTQKLTIFWPGAPRGFLAVSSIHFSRKTSNFLAWGTQGLFGSSPASICVLKLSIFWPGAPRGFLQLPSISVSTKTGHLLACGAQELFGSSPESVPVLKLTNVRPGAPMGFCAAPQY